MDNQEIVRSYLFDRKNWGRWGPDDEIGAINLMTPERRLAALSCVRSGMTLSLSRPISTVAAENNPRPAQHLLEVHCDDGGRPEGTSTPELLGGWAEDFFGIWYHGLATTHLDGLCHVWDEIGMYNGRDPGQHFRGSMSDFAGIENWSNGIVGRAVLLDIPALRGVDYVSAGDPVESVELATAAARQHVEISPGDAVCVYMGRERWQADNPDTAYGDPAKPRPGLGASCLQFLRDHDVSVLGWDMLDARPWREDVAWAIHGGIWSFGIALVDNMLLEPLAELCAARSLYDFLVVVAPLVVVGGTGSPVNPIAIL